MPTIYPGRRHATNLVADAADGKGAPASGSVVAANHAALDVLGRAVPSASRLDARLLRDIGITHYDAKRDAEKPFWQD
tara:strand:- start:62 stop:295 length:234 start_codon:yes stop_codon:yes gene_type:complete